MAELYDGETSRAYNRLKQAITDDTIRCEEKYEAPFDVNNHIHIVASSNSLRALKLSNKDRRWFIPGVTEKKRPLEKWTELNGWLADGGLEAICWWAHDFVKKHKPIQTGMEAPLSVAKQEAIIAAMSDGERMVYDLGTSLVECPEHHVVRLDKIRFWLADRKSSNPHYGTDGYKYLETAETIASVLRSLNLSLPPQRYVDDKQKFRVVANFKIDDQASWTDLRELCLDPQKAYDLGDHPDPLPF